MMSIDLDGVTVNIVVMDMVIGITEQVSANADGSYTVFLNARYSHAALMKAYDHALAHIRRHDWEKTDVQQIEAEAHAKRVRREVSAELLRIRRKLRAYERKYNGMTPVELWKHNDRVIDEYERRKAEL